MSSQGLKKQTGVVTNQFSSIHVSPTCYREKILKDETRQELTVRPLANVNIVSPLPSTLSVLKYKIQVILKILGQINKKVK
jgi:hypothetical protein